MKTKLVFISVEIVVLLIFFYKLLSGHLVRRQSPPVLMVATTLNQGGMGIPILLKGSRVMGIYSSKDSMAIGGGI